MAFRGIQSTNIISTEVGFTDPLLILNKDGSTAVDIGFLGKIGATSYAGLVKDSSTDEFLLINSISLGSTSVNSVDATDLSLVKGDLTAGAITATSFTGDGSALTGITDTNTTYTSSDFTHDDLTGVVANKHIDWTSASAGTIHSSNYTDTNTTYSVGDSGLTQKNFTTTLKNKLDTIEYSADATDTANVTSSGALMTTGGTMTGNLNMGANEIILADNGIIQMGTGDDFNIYHDGADSIIKDKGTGNLALRTNGNFYVVNEASSEVLIRADVNGSVDLYYDNSKKIETTSGGVTVTGTVGATAFTGDGSALTGISSGSSTLASLTDATISSSDPDSDTNPSAVGHFWINSSSGEAFICSDATTDTNIWYNIGEGSGGVGATSNLALSSGLIANYDYESDTSSSSWTNLDGTGPTASSWGNIGTSTVGGISGFGATNGGFDIAGGSWWSSTSFTIQAWMHLRGYNSGNTGIVSQHSNSGRHNWMWNSTSDRFHMNGCKGSTYAGNSGGTGTWRMLTLRYDDGYTYTTDDHLYTATSHSGSGDMCTSSTNISIGARDDHVEPADFVVRKVVFYNRALNDGEVTQNWNLYKSYVGRS